MAKNCICTCGRIMDCGDTLCPICACCNINQEPLTESLHDGYPPGTSPSDYLDEYDG